jgi:DNA repair exonuclease SbcCD ATPase subunit
MDLAAAEQEMKRLSHLIDEANDELRHQIAEYANAEREYRLAEARTWVQAPRERDGVKVTVPEREAWVQGRTAQARYKRDLAEGLKRAAYASIQSRQAQLSAWQSQLGAYREEVSFARGGPR